MKFADLYFGLASAENEVAADPSAFLQSYLDRWDLPRQIESQEKFLILGPKGSGKSAAAHYLALRWKRDFGESAVFHRAVDFDELNRSQTPLTGLDNELVSSQVTAITDAAWKLFIGIRMLESLASDNEGYSRESVEL